MPWRDTQSSRLHRLFFEGFSAMDIAEPLVSFDENAQVADVHQFMQKKRFDLVGVRRNGLVEGYVRHEDLTSGVCGDHFRPFTPDDDLVPDTANLIDVVKSLSINQQCFVTILDHVGAIITLTDLEKPPMRMFLFGMITIIEMTMTEVLRQRYPGDSWQEFLSEKRVDVARKLQDKGWIITYDEQLRESLGHKSRRETRTAVKEFETLRNNLAHTQEIIPSGWQRIVIACSRWESNLDKTVEDYHFGQKAKTK
jgi:hypothetical protein